MAKNFATDKCFDVHTNFIKYVEILEIIIDRESGFANAWRIWIFMRLWGRKNR